MQFTEARFQSPPPRDTNAQSANRMRTDGEPPPTGDSIDQQMEAWLKETRSGTRIQFKKEAFQ